MRWGEASLLAALPTAVSPRRVAIKGSVSWRTLAATADRHRFNILLPRERCAGS